MKRKWIHIAIAIFLICLGPVIYLHNAYAYPPDISSSAFSYTGRCTDIFVEVEHHGKWSRNIYFLSMDDGREFWIDGIFLEEGDFSYTRFHEKALGGTVSLRYIDVNANWGSFAKEIVELHNDTETFLAMDAVVRADQTTRRITWGAYAVLLVFHSLVVLIDYSDARRQRKLSAHRQQTKAKRRAWLDAHPEEKSTPPSARRKKDRR